MGNWTKQAKIGPILFDGDTITLYTTRMSVEGMQQIMPFMHRDEATGEVKVAFADSLKMLEVATKLLPEYIQSIDGMKDGEGHIISAERYNKELINEFYFMEFTAEVLSGLCQASIVTEKEEKNSETPSSVSSLAQGVNLALLEGVN